MKSPSQWVEILTNAGVKPDTAAKWADWFSTIVLDSSFSRPDEIDDFLANILHESGMLERLEEGLSYSAERLCAVWPNRFPTIEAATPYARNPVALANKVYGGRLGNNQPGDGFAFRGRGLIQVTGRDNYRRLGEAMGQDLEANPDLLAQPSYALESAIAWWENNVPDAFIGDVARTRKAVNGGTIGLAHVQELTDKLDGIA